MTLRESQYPNPRPLTSNVSRLALFLFLFSIYLLTYTPRINSSDGLAMFSTAESIVRRGPSALDIEQIRWMDLQQGTFGLDGLLYSRKGIGVPIGLLPLTWLGLVVPWWGTVGVSLLFNAIVTTLTAVLLSAYLQKLGFTRRTGLIVALTFGLTTLAWPYAKSLFSDPFSGFLLLVAAYSLLKFRREETILTPALFYPFLAGLCLGWNVATRYAEALFVPVFGLLLLYYLYKDLRFRVHNSYHKGIPLGQFAILVLTAFTLPLLLIGLALIAFNLSRYGDPFNTGYLPNETFSGILWQGLLGQLLSPGRGLFLYCPIFLLSLVGFWPFFRRWPAEAVMALSIILIHLFLYGKWFMWHGGYAWGPRFMVPTLPFWAIFLAPVAERAFNEARGGEEAKMRRKFHFLTSSPLRLIFLILTGLGLIPQLLSVTIDFAPFQNSLLDTSLPLFDPQTFFDPRYSPFAGAWKFISLPSLDVAWAWQGQVNGWLLLALIVNLLLAGFNLYNGEIGAIEEEKMGRGLNGSSELRSPKSPDFGQNQALPLICILFTLGTVAFLMVHTHSLPAQPLTEAVAALNEGVRPNDAVITNDPEIAMPFAELYKGRAPVLGLQSGGFPLPGGVTRRLNEIIAAHRQIWWLPNGIPSEESALEQTLMRAGFRARNDDFAGQRLVLFAFPPKLETRLVKAEFEQQITLMEAAYLSQNSAGAVLPLELHWQTQAPLGEDYHVFIHLVDQDGRLMAQADGQPVLWTRPTTTWAVGETIVDRYGLWIPPQTEPGNYELRVGLYRPAEGQRLRLATGEEWVSLRVDVE